MPKVSVVIPTRNRAGMMPETLDSVLAQTFTDFEVIVSNNHSTDDTARVLSEYAARDGRVRPVMPPEPGAAADNVNNGLRHATGDYVAILCDDDLWVPEFLAKTCAVLDTRPDVHAVAAAFWEWSPQHNYENPWCVTEPEGVIADGLCYYMSSAGGICLASTIHRREGVCDEPIPSTSTFDEALYIRLLERGEAFYRLPIPLARYRIHAGSGVAKTVAFYNDVLGIYENRRFSTPQAEALRAMKMGTAHLTLSRAHGEAGETTKARFHARQALRLIPRHKRAWLAWGLAHLPRTLAGALVNGKRRVDDTEVNQIRRGAAA